MDDANDPKPDAEMQPTEVEDNAMLDSMRPGNALLEICRKVGLDINQITRKKKPDAE